MAFSLKGLGSILGTVGGAYFGGPLGAEAGAAAGGSFGSEIGGWFDKDAPSLTGAEQGREAYQYWKNAYPGITPWEATGSGAAATGAQVVEAGQKRQFRQQDRMMSQERQQQMANLAVQLKMTDRNNIARLLAMYADDPEKAREIVSFYQSDSMSDLSATEGNFQLLARRLGLDERRLEGDLQRMSFQNRVSVAEEALTNIRAALEEPRYELERSGVVIDNYRAQTERTRVGADPRYLPERIGNMLSSMTAERLSEVAEDAAERLGQSGVSLNNALSGALRDILGLPEFNPDWLDGLLEGE